MVKLQIALRILTSLFAAADHRIWLYILSRRDGVVAQSLAYVIRGMKGVNITLMAELHFDA